MLVIYIGYLPRKTIVQHFLYLRWKQEMDDWFNVKIKCCFQFDALYFHNLKMIIIISSLVPSLDQIDFVNPLFVLLYIYRICSIFMIVQGLDN
jgi:hypothetical protein